MQLLQIYYLDFYWYLIYAYVIATVLGQAENI